MSDPAVDQSDDATKENRSGCPRNDFLEGGRYLVSPLFAHGRPQSNVSCLAAIATFRADEDGVDADVPVDAKNASTSDFEN